MIGIINYGMGNLKSVENSLHFLDVSCTIFDDPGRIGEFEKLILPGVGAFGQAMQNLNSSGFTQAIRTQVLEKSQPILGICLGMQLFLNESEEHGHHEGLGLLPGKVRNFKERVTDLPVPHMGWNTLQPVGDPLLLRGFEEPESICYFVHNYYCEAANREHVAATGEYGITFDAMLESGHILGCQFHPEKSQKHGLHILRQYADASW